MKAKYLSLLLAATFVASSPAKAAIDVLTCEPEWAALVTEIGGDKVNAYSATTAFQDPHHIEARPSLIARARKADLLFCTGAELEIGWLPVLLSKSGNPNIQPNTQGYLMATDYVELLEKLKKVDRSMGDVHAAGNPHVHLDPNRVIKISAEVASRLSQIDPANKALFQQNQQQFKSNIEKFLSNNASDIKKLVGMRWIVHHNNWVYLNEWLGLEQVATLEPKPGIPPTTKHLASLLKTIQQQDITVIAYGSYQSDKAAKWLSGKSGIPFVQMPYTVDKWQEPNALVNWYQDILTILTSNINK